MDLKDRLDAVREKARKGGLPARRKDADLYALLDDIYALCHDIDVQGQRQELVAALRDRANDDRNRVYAQHNTDNHLLVCRYVLEGEDNRGSIYRYGMALKEATKRQIRPGELHGWLNQNGGINRLFKGRPLSKRTYDTSILQLTKKIAAPKDAVLKLTLRADERGYFDVLQYECEATS